MTGDRVLRARAPWGVRAGSGRKRGDVRKKLLWVVALAALTVLLGACAKDLPQDTFEPAGPTAQEQKDLLIPVLWVALAVFILVEGGILLISFKYRHRKGRDRMPAQTHGNTRLEIGWTIAPAVILAFVMVPAISMIWDLDRREPDALQVTVKGYQWWWGFEYTDPDMTVDYGDHGPIVTADALVIPAGETVQLSLESAGGGARTTDGIPDFQVIHSFWAPKLFGKQDAVPGQTGHIVFSADEPGVYWGQCAEFCGLQHGMMKFRIVALSDADWQAWVHNHKQPAVTPTDPLALKGMDLFLNGAGNGQCIACHAIGGTEAAANAAPNLTRFADPTHRCFAGCNFELYNPDGTPNEEALRAWLRDPSAVKLGAKMPDYQLSEEEIDALVAYLYSLT
jgi:cytochrome c oxidase subunit II